MAIVCTSPEYVYDVLEQGYVLNKPAVKQKFIMDSAADFANLPKCCTGSIAIVADGSTGYMVNASGNWVENTKVATSYLMAEEASF